MSSERVCNRAGGRLLPGEPELPPVAGKGYCRDRDLLDLAVVAISLALPGALLLTLDGVRG